jgi:hypothetical protein
MKLGLSRLLLIVLAGLLAVLIGSNALVRSDRGGARIGGRDAVHRPELIARIDTISVSAERLGAGELRAVAYHGGWYYLLQRDQWLRVRGASVEGPFGIGSAGGPGALQGAADLVVTDTSVFVLDVRTRQLVVFDPGGVYRNVLKLGPSFGLARPEQLLQDDTGQLYVTAQAFRTDTTVWEIRTLTAGEPVTLRLSGQDLLGPFDELRARAIAGDTILAVTTQAYAARLVHAGQVVRTWQRADPPLYSIPDSIRRRYATRIGGLDPGVRARIALPAAAPPVRGIGVLPGGRTAIALSRDFGSVDVEVLDVAGIPIGRVTDRPWPAPVLFAAHRAIVLQHEPHRLLVISHVFR